MITEIKDSEKQREIVKLLPKEDCGKCGYDNCGAFAVALVAGKASPLDCHGSIPNVKEICEILGIEVPEGAELQTVGFRGHHHGGHHGYHGHGTGRRGYHH